MSTPFQACRVVQYGTVTIRTVLVKLRRTTVIVTPYFTVITVKNGAVYGTVPSWHRRAQRWLAWTLKSRTQYLIPGQ